MGHERSIWWKIPGVIVWMAALLVLAVDFTSTAGTLAALCGVAAAFYAAHKLAAAPVRLGRLWAMSIATLAMLALLGYLMRENAMLAKVFGSPAVYTFTETASWGAGTLLLLAPLLLSASRYASFLSVEAAVLVTIFASAFAAHRDGSVHRPYFVTDWLLERNIDPLPFFLMTGAMLGGMLIVWLVSRRTAKRSLFDPLLLVAMILGLLLFLPDGKIRQLNAWAAAGNGEKEQKQKPQGGGGSGGSDQKKKEQKQEQNQNQDPNPSNGSGGKSFPVAVVNLHDDYTPPYGTFYFRQDALSTWNGKRLVRDASGKLDTDVGIPFPAEAVDVPLRDRADTATPTGRKRVAHRMKTTVALMTPHSKPFALIDAARFEPAANPDPKRFERAYKAESIVLDTDFHDLLERAAGSDKWTPEIWQHYTRMPEDPRYRKIAEEARAALPAHLRNVTLAQALAVKYWLDKNTTYNLNVPRADDESDPVEKFLFGDRNGYCVHLAHSAAYLFRSLGLPARVSVGYAVDARQRGSGSAVLVRNGDAHAWPEVYVRGLGWVVLDITPEKVATPPQQDKADPELQRMLGEMARNTPASPKEENPPPGDGDVRKAFLEALWALSKMLAPLLATTIVALYLMKIWRRLEPRFCSEKQLPVAAYRAALDTLSDLGLARAFGASREEFAMAVPSPEFAQLTDAHMRHSLGAGAPSWTRAKYLELTKAVSAKVAASVPLWRRAVGIANPLSWWRVS